MVKTTHIHRSYAFSKIVLIWPLMLLVRKVGRHSYDTKLNLIVNINYILNKSWHNCNISITFTADQEFDLVRDEQGVVEYNPKVVTFSSVHHLSLHIPSNFGADETKIYWIGLKGEYTEAQRTGVVNAVYEARPMMQDHKQDSGAQENFSRGPQC